MSYRRDWQGRRHPQSLGWTDAEFLKLAREHPDACISMGSLSDFPGTGVARRIGPEVDHFQSLAKAAGLEPRICFGWRFDVYRKLDPEATHRVLKTTYCRHRSPSPCRDWDGDLDGITGDGLGGSDRFDTGWILTTQRAVYDAIIGRYWNGNDFCGDPSKTRHDWSNRDKEAMCELLTAEASPMWYVNPGTGGGTSMQDVHVGLDLRKPGTREWNARRLVALLADYGCTPGERCGFIWAYKPGWWTYYGGADAGRRCGRERDPKPRSWRGYRLPGDACASPLFAPTPYGPGEFEEGVSQQYLAFDRALDAAGFADGDVGFVTTERPPHRDRAWIGLSEAVRTHPRMLGERAAQHSFGSRSLHGWDRESPVADAGGGKALDHPEGPFPDSDGKPGERVRLDGSRSRANGAPIAEFVWRLGVGGPTLCRGARAECRVPVDGLQVIELVVKDEQGRADSDYIWIEIRAPAEAGS